MPETLILQALSERLERCAKRSVALALFNPRYEPVERYFVRNKLLTSFHISAGAVVSGSSRIPVLPKSALKIQQDGSPTILRRNARQAL